MNRASGINLSGEIASVQSRVDTLLPREEPAGNRTSRTGEGGINPQPGIRDYPPSLRIEVTGRRVSCEFWDANGQTENKRPRQQRVAPNYGKNRAANNCR